MKFFAAATLALAAVATAAPAASPVEATTADEVLNVLEARQATCSAATTDNLIFNVSISSFQNSRNAKNPSGCDWSSDNCSKSPDKPRGYNFIPSCQRHDFGYRNTKKQGRFDSMKRRIDDKFKSDLYAYCSQFSGLSSWKGVECRRYADIYVAAVRAFGKREEDEGHYLPEMDIEEED